VSYGDRGFEGSKLGEKKRVLKSSCRVLWATEKKQTTSTDIPH